MDKPHMFFFYPTFILGWASLEERKEWKIRDASEQHWWCSCPWDGAAIPGGCRIWLHGQWPWKLQCFGVTDCWDLFPGWDALLEVPGKRLPSCLFGFRDVHYKFCPIISTNIFLIPKCSFLPFLVMSLCAHLKDFDGAFPKSLDMFLLLPMKDN